MAPLDLLHLLAQAKPEPNVELELLKEQLKFLEKSNADLVGTFKFFIGIAGSSIALSVVAFWKNLNEAKKLINDSVKEAVDRRISASLETRIDDIERAVLTETRVRKTRVCYWIPKNGEPDPPMVDLLKVRGFAKLKTISSNELPRQFPDVIIVDLNCWSPTEDEIDRALLQVVGQATPNDSVILYYGSGRSDAIDRFKGRSPTRNILPANSPASLMGCVVDAVYLSHAQFENQRR